MKMDLVGTEHCASDPIEGLDDGFNEGQSLGSLRAVVIATSSEVGVPTESTPNPGSV